MYEIDSIMSFMVITILVILLAVNIVAGVKYRAKIKRLQEELKQYKE